MLVTADTLNEDDPIEIEIQASADEEEDSGFGDMFRTPSAIDTNAGIAGDDGLTDPHRRSTVTRPSPEVQQGNSERTCFQKYLLNAASLIMAIGLVVAVIVFWTNDYIKNPEDKAISVLYGFGVFITSSAMVVAYVDDPFWSLMESLQFRGVISSSMVMQLTNCYSDAAILYGYYMNGEDESAIVFFLAMILYRFVSIAWVWFNYHSITMAFLQFFECLTVHEAVRSFSQMVIYVSMFQIGIFEIVLEDLPSILLVLRAIGKGRFKIRSFAVLASLITSLGAVVARNVSFDNLQMKDNRWRESKVNFFMHLIFRFSESYARLAALTLVFMHNMIVLVVLLVVEAIVVFTINRKYTDKRPNQCMKYALLWLVNLPVLSAESLEYHLTAPERRKIQEKNKEIRGSKFQELFEAVEKGDNDQSWTYKDSVEKAIRKFERFANNVPVEVTIKGRRYPIKKPDLVVPAETSPEGVHSYPFVMIVLGFRMVCNLLILLVCLLIPMDDIEKTLEKVLTHLTWTGSLIMLPTLYFLLKKDCIMKDEEGMQLVGAPFERRMNWTELLDGQKKYEQNPTAENTKNLIAHIENFIIIGKNVLEPNQKGELVTTMAARLGLDKVINICKKAGLDMNKADLNGYTPLIMAVIMNHRETAELLLEVRHSWNTSCRYNDLLVDPNRCSSGGHNVPPLLVAAYHPPSAQEMIDFLCSKGADIDFENKTGNVMHAVFNMTIGKYDGFGHEQRTELLETIIKHAKDKGVEQKMLDSRRLNYLQENIANFPPTVLDRLVWNNRESDEVNGTFIDFLVKEGATIFPSVLAGLLECEKYDLFERIFTNQDFLGDKIAILSEPWHGGSFTGHYEGISTDDDDDFCVTMNLCSSHDDDDDDDDENPTTTKLTFTKSWKFVRGEVPYSCKLMGWDGYQDEENQKMNLDVASMDIWPDLLVKSIGNECMENVKYEEVKQIFEDSQQNGSSNLTVKLSTGMGFQRQLVNMLEKADAPEKFLDLTREILEGSSSPFMRRLNVTPGNDLPEPAVPIEAAQVHPESPRSLASDDDVPSEFGDMFNGSNEEQDGVEKRGPEEATANNQDEDEDESNGFDDMFGDKGGSENANDDKRVAHANNQEVEESDGFDDMFGGDGGPAAASSPVQSS